jgi:hypothetical protein
MWDNSQKPIMATWTRRPQECNGSYFFSGKLIATMKVVAEIPIEEITQIWDDLREFIKQENGVDRLQIYTNETGARLYFIDQLNKEMIETNMFGDEDNYCTLMFAEEY